LAFLRVSLPMAQSVTPAIRLAGAEKHMGAGGYFLEV
jgi:hypothetical protein